MLRALPGLGDMLLAVPALQALRDARPSARIVLIGLPSAGWLLERYQGLVDELLLFPGWPGMPERSCQRETLLPFLAAARARRFDLALQLHGSGLHSNGFVDALGARRRCGQCPGDGERHPDFVTVDESLHELDRQLRVLHHAGIAAGRAPPRFPLREHDRSRADAMLGDATVREPSPYACLHPGASAPARRLAPRLLAAVGDRLAARGLRVVLTGSAAESQLTSAVAAAMRRPAKDLAGRTPELGALAGVLASARVLVCPDTGVAHLGQALTTPCVVAAAACSDLRRWGPLEPERHRVVRLGPRCDASALVLAAEELLADRGEGGSSQARARVSATREEGRPAGNATIASACRRDERRFDDG